MILHFYWMTRAIQLERYWGPGEWSIPWWNTPDQQWRVDLHNLEPKIPILPLGLKYVYAGAHGFWWSKQFDLIGPIGMWSLLQKHHMIKLNYFIPESELYPLTHLQCKLLEFIHGSELFHPWKNCTVYWSVRCVSIFSNPWVIWLNHRSQKQSHQGHRSSLVTKNRGQSKDPVRFAHIKRSSIILY